MSLKEKLILCGMVAVTVIVALAAFAWLNKPATGPSGFTSGAAGNLLAELYIPVIQQNGGYNSALPINTSGALSTSGTLQVGTSGKAQSKLIITSCALIASSFTVAASTTVSMDCAVTGAASGDLVIAGLATSSVIYNGWEITAASASSTAGFDTFRVYNGTGASNIIPASVASSTPVINAL